MQALSAIEIEHRRRTRLTCWMGVHSGIVSNRNRARRHTRLTFWMGFHAGIVSNRNQADEAHTTHKLDGISCRHCQRSKSSRRGAHDSLPGWDFMQALSAIEIEQTRCIRLTNWMGFHASSFSIENQLCNLVITSCRQYSDIAPLLIQSLPHFP